MKYAPDRDDPIPADVIAAAIVAASRAVGADPVAVGSGELDRVAGLENHERVIARARYYAGFALRCLYPNRNRTLLAAYVGTTRKSAGSFFSALDQRLNSGLSWWRQDVVDQVVSAAADAVVVKPRTAPPPPLKVGPLPAPKFTDRLNEKKACYDILAEAAANTARLQAKLPPERDE